jgi:hypothetical protein
VLFTLILIFIMNSVPLGQAQFATNPSETFSSTLVYPFLKSTDDALAKDSFLIIDGCDTDSEDLNKIFISISSEVDAHRSIVTDRDWRVYSICKRGVWAYAYIKSYFQNSFDPFPSPSDIALIRLTPSGWITRLPEKATEYNAWLASIPNELISDSMKNVLFQPELSAIVASVENFSGYYLPYPGGQGANAAKHAYPAIDFGILGSSQIGTVRSSKGGIAIFVKDSSTRECGDPPPDDTCWQWANAIIIQSGPNEYAWYMHFAYNTIPNWIQEGTYIPGGTDLGQEGKTGWASGPHVHFMVADNYQCCWGSGDSRIPHWPDGNPTSDGVTHPVDFIEYSWNQLPSWAVSQNIGSNCPQAGGVILYWNANYNCDNNHGDPGYRQRTSPGFQNVNDGSFNDKASSVKVPSGWSVRLYEHENGGGGSICYSSDLSDFGTQGNFQGTSTTINDSVSSMEVYDNTNCGSNPQPTPQPGEWNVEYFNDTTLTNRCSPPNQIAPGPFVFHDWGDDSPYPGCNSDNWSARFWRTVHFQSGTYDFGLGSDDWSRLIIDRDVVLNNWQGAGQHYASRPYSEGDRQVTVEFADTLGSAKLAAWWWGPGFDVPRESRDPYQWFAQYWGNKELWWDAIVQINEGTGPLNHQWGSNGPGYGLPVDKFSSRFERQIYFSCGTYSFNISTDDGVRFWIDNQQLLDEWRDQGANFSVDHPVSEGYHELKVEHFEDGGGAQISLDWSLLSACSTPTPTPTSTPTCNVCYNFNGSLDGEIDVQDILFVANRWGETSSDPSYDSKYDVFCSSSSPPDGNINVLDIQTVANQWGQQSCQPAVFSPGELGGRLKQFELTSIPTATVSVYPQVNLIDVGDSVELEILIDNAQNLGGFEFRVSYDPSVVQVSSADSTTLGDFLGSTGRTATLLSPIIDNNLGSLKVGAFSLGSSEGPSGAGKLVNIKFDSVGAGLSDININDILLATADISPQTQPSIGIGGSITVSSPLYLPIVIR